MNHWPASSSVIETKVVDYCFIKLLSNFLHYLGITLEGVLVFESMRMDEPIPMQSNARLILVGMMLRLFDMILGLCFKWKILEPAPPLRQMDNLRFFLYYYAGEKCLKNFGLHKPINNTPALSTGMREVTILTAGMIFTLPFPGFFLWGIFSSRFFRSHIFSEPHREWHTERKFWLAFEPLTNVHFLRCMTAWKAHVHLLSCSNWRWKRGFRVDFQWNILLFNCCRNSIILFVTLTYYHRQ